MVEIAYQLNSKAEGSEQEFSAVLDGKVSLCGLTILCNQDSTFSVSYFGRSGKLEFGAPYPTMPAAQARALQVLTEMGEVPASENPYQCPVCGKDDKLQVVVSTFATLSQRAGQIAGTEPVGDHEWDFDSAMWCACGHHAKARDFQNPAVAG